MGNCYFKTEYENDNVVGKPRPLALRTPQPTEI